VLRRTAIEIANRIGWRLEPSRSGFLPDSVQRWKPFRETNPQLTKLARKYKLGLLSNIDDKLLGQTRRHIPTDFDLVVTAQQVRSYKPEPAHFTECARRVGGKRGWVHVASSHYHDVVPCVKARVPVIWVNRAKQKLEPSQKKPTAEVTNLRAAAKLLGVS
jgi:2-haloacid dehalogenase/putative hydrolase of the HAD superfamily